MREMNDLTDKKEPKLGRGGKIAIATVAGVTVVGAAAAYFLSDNDVSLYPEPECVYGPPIEESISPVEPSVDSVDVDAPSVESLNEKPKEERGE